MGKCYLYTLRISQVLLTWLTFGLAIHGAELTTARAALLTSWALSPIGTLMVVVIKFFQLEVYAPNLWTSFQVAVAGFAFLLCLSATLGLLIFYLAASPQGKVLHFRLASGIFSLLVTVAYMCEIVGLRNAEAGRKDYQNTTLGRFKISEVFVACFIFMLISDPSSYKQYRPLQWCVAVYSLCFISSVVVTLTNMLERPSWYSRLSKCCCIVAVLLYLTATAIWPLYQFSSRYSNQTHRPASCCEPGCLWDQKAAVAVLTAINLLIYLGDAIITVCDKDEEY